MPDETPGLPMPPRRRSLLTPRVVFPTLLVVLVLSVLLTPVTGREGDARLTTLSRAPQGAQGFAETLERLGWRVERDSAPTPRRGAALPAGVVYAVLDPPEALTAREVHRYLDAVRRGAGLLVVVGTRGEPFADSLGVAHAEGAIMRGDTAALRAACAGDDRTWAINWTGGWVYSYWLRAYRPLPRDTVHFHAVNRSLTRREREAAEARPDSARRHVAERRPEPAALGMPLGRGRVVAIADADWLRNDVVRVCRWRAGVQAVRMAQWLLPAGAAPTLIVDEYHQGRGTHPSAWRALRGFLLGHPLGRALMVATGAALVLLAAAAGRALAPERAAVIERRSPLEHVGALARAYERIGATRLATRRLVRGLRRRTATGTLRALPDEQYLAAIAERHPALATETGVVRDALTQPRTPEQLLEVGRAVAHIERTLLQ